MKNRREFLHLSSLGFLYPLIKPAGKSDSNRNIVNAGIVKQPEDGETFFVRENTPITILISKKTDSVETVSLCYEEIQPGGRIPVQRTHSIFTGGGRRPGRVCGPCVGGRRIFFVS